MLPAVAGPGGQKTAVTHVLGIDAGGTKTVCILADVQGRPIAEARGSGANLSATGELAVERTLRQLVGRVIDTAAVEPDAIGVGMAGVDRPSDGQIVREVLRRVGLRGRIVVANDALIALVAGAGWAPGVVMAAGTGSIVYGRNAANRAARAGGWGPVLADEGSGYWIGRQALVAVMREWDGRGPATTLTPAVLGHFGLARPEDLIQLVYARDLSVPAIAEVASVVGAAQTAGDRVARDILDRAVDELMVAAEAVVRALDLAGDPVPVFLAGGLFGGSAWLQGEIGRRMATLMPGAPVRRLGQPAAMGAVRLALEELAGGAVLPEYVARR